MSDTGGDVSMTSMEGSSLEKQLIIGSTVGATCMVVWTLVVFAILVARHSAKKERERREEEERRRTSRSALSHLSTPEPRLGEHSHSSSFHHLAFSSRSFSSGLGSTDPGVLDTLGPSILPLHSYHDPFLGRRNDAMSISGLTSVASSNRSGRPAIVPFRSSNLPQSDNVHYNREGRIQPYSRQHSTDSDGRSKRSVGFEADATSRFNHPRPKPTTPVRKVSPASHKISSSSSSTQEYEMKTKHKVFTPRASSPRAASPPPGATRMMAPGRHGFTWSLKTDDHLPGTSSAYPAHAHTSGFIPELTRSISQDEASIYFDEEHEERVWLPRNSPNALRIMSEGSLIGFDDGMSDGSSSSGSDRRRRSNIPSFVAAEYDRIFERSAPARVTNTHQSPNIMEQSVNMDYQLPDSGYYDEVLRKSSLDR